MSAKNVRLALVIIIVLFITVALIFAIHLKAGNTVNSSLIGQNAPNIYGTNLFNKEPISLKNLEQTHKLVLVNFMASWCPPCHEEEPVLSRFYFYNKNKINILSVAMNDIQANTISFLKQNSATWPVIDDPNGSFAISYGVTGPPETFIISDQNKILAKIVGPVTYNELSKLLTIYEFK